VPDAALYYDPALREERKRTARRWWQNPWGSFFVGVGGGLLYGAISEAVVDRPTGRLILNFVVLVIVVSISLILRFRRPREIGLLQVILFSLVGASFVGAVIALNNVL